ncbi:MAG: hypothetical protein LBT20_01730 [Clostridiales bacterium]|nr:hypothetical protein [Clostridiales bacterium]
MFVSKQYLLGSILVVVFVLPIIIWKIIYGYADKHIYERINKADNAVTYIGIVEFVGAHNGKKNGFKKSLYSVSVLTGEDAGDKIPNRYCSSNSRFERGDFVLIKFIKEQYQNCLILRKAGFEEYKKQYPDEYWVGYDGDGSDLLDAN